MQLHYRLMDGFYCQDHRAVLMLDGGEFPRADPVWDEVPEISEVIPIGELQTAYLRFYGEEPLQFSRNLLEAGSNAAGSRFEKLPHHARPTYRINFKNYVGQASLAGFRVKVTHRKITEGQFNAMLDFLCEEYAALIFSFRQIAGSHWRKHRAGKDSLYLQYLLLRRYLLRATPDLDGIAGLVHRDLHERFITTVAATPIDRVRELDNAALLNLFSGAANWGRLTAAHPLANAPLAGAVHRRTGQHLFPTRLHTTQREHTVDTPENRFVKFFLGGLERLSAAIKTTLGQGTFLNPEIGADIDRLEQSLDRFQAEPRWREVGALRHLAAQSTVLHRRAGYRELFRLYSLLQLVSRHDPLLDFTALADLKNVPLLYEYWCFFQVKRIVDAILGSPIACRPLSPDTGGLETILAQGLRIDYGNGAILYYNPTCTGGGSGELASYSHNLRPDILLTFRGRKLVLDAKYKGFYSDDDTISKPKDEDIDKMHGYRDAIRDVWGAFALYPGDTSPVYRAFTAAPGAPYEGVGALALRSDPLQSRLPSGADQVAKVIRHFLACD